jgi:alpha-amylase
VQISPPMEQITADQWWASYQPVSYKIGNHLGDEAAFLQMVQTCRKCGVGIVVDAVISNERGVQTSGSLRVPTHYSYACAPLWTDHMAAGSGSGTSGSSFSARTFPGTYSPNDFHHNSGDTSSNCVISNYQDKWNVQHCDLVGLPDLDSGADYTRRTIGAYLTGLTAVGVSGFRVDAAKHQDASELGAILAAGNTSHLEVYQEVIGAPGEAVQPSEYVGNGRVTEFGYSYQLADKVRASDLAGLHGLGGGLLPSDKALVFTDNHDSQRASSALAAMGPRGSPLGSPLGNPLAHRGLSVEALRFASGVLTYKDGASYAVANAFMLAWPYGRVRLMSSYYFTDHDAGAPSTPVHDGQGNVACGDGHPWVCEHRWPAIAGMVGWRRAAGSEDVGNWQQSGSGRVAFSRGRLAFVAFSALSAGTWSATLQTMLPAGTYCDVAADDACKNTVVVGADGTASILVGSSGSNVVALHVNATARFTTAVSSA